MSFVEDMFVNPGVANASFTKCLTAAAHAAAANATNATMLADLLADCEDTNEGKLPAGAYGGFQLLFLMVCYGYFLVNGANYIGDGAELLLLVPSMEGVVGTLVLPILGAVPDGAMVFFSGLGPTAQTQLSVGMGALAGSTIMLLTVPWFLSILAGRVDIENGECVYKRPKGTPKLTPGRGMTQSGVSPDSAVPVSCRIMMATCISYIVIQAPAMSRPKFKPTPESNAAGDAIEHEADFALVALITTGTMFVLVCVYQVYAGGGDNDVNSSDAKLNEVKVCGQLCICVCLCVHPPLELGPR
jgi:hypothetical protein